MSVLLTFVLPDGTVHDVDYLPENQYPGVSQFRWAGDPADFPETDQYDFRIISSEDHSFGDGSTIHEVTLAPPRVH